MFTLRLAQPADAAALAALAANTFRDAFAAQNQAADIEAYCAQAFSPTLQARELADAAATTLLVEEAGALYGYAQLWVTQDRTAELRRFYVTRALHGRGLAQQLMERVLDEARARGAVVLTLGVWEENPRAIRFYEKCGFTPSGAHTFVLGQSLQRDVLMCRTL